LAGRELLDMMSFVVQKKVGVDITVCLFAVDTTISYKSDEG
jgi:hypothetical protein